MAEVIDPEIAQRNLHLEGAQVFRRTIRIIYQILYILDPLDFFIIASRAPQLAQFPRLILPSILMFRIPALVLLQTGHLGCP